MKKIEGGDPFSKIMYIGEHPGQEELSRGEPFVGPSGWELEKMTGLAGLKLREGFLTNLLHELPAYGKIERMFYTKKQAEKLGVVEVDGRYPNDAIVEARKMLASTIEEKDPDLIICLGAAALWAVTGENGIMKWRGSIMEANGRKVIPTFNPAGVLHNWPWRWLCIQDFRRCFREMQFPEIRKPAWNYIITPTASEAIELLESLRGQVNVCDTETRNNHIDCIGFASSKLDAFCIPFSSLGHVEGYYTREEEIAIVLKMRDVMTDENTTFIFHNAAYDVPYIAKDFGFIVRNVICTMIMQHICFPGLKKSLDFCASLYCNYYRYWKDDGRKWDPRIHSEDQHWLYNCDDCTYTFEVFENLIKTIKKLGFQKQYDFQMKLFKVVLKMMLRGTRVDLDYKNRLSGEFLIAMQSRSQWFEDVLGHEFNPRSNGKTGQMQKLFYDDFKIKPVIDRKTHERTLDDEALETMIVRQPLVRPLVEVIQEYRSIGIFKANFADAALSFDDRMRCNVSQTRAKTYRFATSKDIIREGCNMQTIPKGTEKD